MAGNETQMLDHQNALRWRPLAREEEAKRKLSGSGWREALTCSRGDKLLLGDSRGCVEELKLPDDARVFARCPTVLVALSLVQQRHEQGSCRPTELAARWRLVAAASLIQLLEKLDDLISTAGHRRSDRMPIGERLTNHRDPRQGFAQVLELLVPVCGDTASTGPTPQAA